MNKKLIPSIFLGVALLVLLTVGVLKGSAQETFGEKPTPLSAKYLTPAPTPEDGREIAILTLVIISSPEGKIESIHLERGQIVKGYAPNVLGMTGEWIIELIGEQESVKYGVLDPRYVEVENEQNVEQPFTYIFETNYVWELVVPLYDDDKNLAIKTINIYDLDGNLIFSVEVDWENWRK